MWNSVVYAQEAGNAAPPEANPFMPLLFIVVIIAIFYFLLMRPNMKREKERREMLSSLEKGDEIITTGGIYGTIVNVNEQTIVVRVSDDPPMKLQFARGAVSRKVTNDE